MHNAVFSASSRITG